MVEQLRILLVEDNAEDRILIRRALQPFDSEIKIEVEEASTLAAGLEALRAQVFDCALVDYRLPDGNALSLLQIVGQQGLRQTPVIVLTGHDEAVTAVRMLKEGAQEYLVKGQVDGRELVTALWNAAHRARLSAQLERARVDLDLRGFLDPLTEALNDRGFEHIVEKELARAAAEGLRLFGLILRFDDLKTLRETAGEAAAHLLVKNLADLAKQSLGKAYPLARVAEDQLIAVLCGARAIDALEIAADLRAALAQTLAVAGLPAKRPAVSDAVFELRPGVSSGAMLAEAHRALALALEPSMKALELRVRIQPIMRLSDGRRTASELLIAGPEGPLERPEDLFRVSMRSNELASLDLECFERCARAAVELGDEPTHLNLFPSTLLATPAEDLLAMLPADRKPEDFCIGISAQQIRGDPFELSPRIARLKEAGVTVALDQVDFSRQSLESLVALRPDMIKIDLGVRPSSDAIGRLVRAAASLRIDVGAVGIESAAEIEPLFRLGVKYAQGFLWGPLRPAWTPSRVQSPG